MQEALSIRFAETAQELAAAARPMGWTIPTFRSPPGVAGAVRTLRRRPDGSVVVAVTLRQRPWPAVQADMIDGVVVANRLEGLAAERCRAHLRRALLGPGLDRAAA